jgi:RHS repeat-associated protein
LIKRIKILSSVPSRYTARAFLRGLYAYDLSSVNMTRFYTFSREHSYFTQKFTGKERDAETGLDYFGARYYSGAQGRFLSVDPENAGAKKNDPQSWNAYAYSRNNPLKYVDPDGKLYELAYDYQGYHTSFQLSDWGFSAYTSRLSQYFTFSGGIIYSAQYGYQVGTYRWIIDDRLLAIKQAGELASPAANILTEAMKIFGWIAAPEAMAIAEYASGEDRSEVSLALAVIPGGKIGAEGKTLLSKTARSKLGNLLSRAEETIAVVIRDRGGNAANVREAGEWAQKTLAETARAAASGNPNAERAIKIAKDAARLGQKY